MLKEYKARVLVVDDEQIDLDLAIKTLEDKYEVLTATNGEAAYELLTKHGDEIDLVLVDVYLPQMDGLQLMRLMQQKGLGRIPVIIMTGDNEVKREAYALEQGAADFIRKPLYPSILRNRIQNVLLRHQQEYDRLTGLYNRSKTFSMIREMVKRNLEKQLALVRYDIDNFSIYNASMGEAEGDRLLLMIAEALRNRAKTDGEFVYGRINADVFLICQEYDEATIKECIKEEMQALENYRKDYRLESSFGICPFKGTEVSIERLYTKASLAAHTCKGTYNKRYAFYEPWMEKNISEAQEIANDMVVALEEKQFVPYLQPKFDLSSDKPCGAEALVRWLHPTKGIIVPYKFIPVFEKNGFIAKLDYYMWDAVCQLLRKWRQESGKAYPISVNVSRISLYNPKLAEIFLKLIEKYDLTPDLLQLEITESAYMSNPNLMKHTIQELQAYGFTVMMDDFGSGYSSLNTLKEINIDILKVDMAFLPNEDKVERSGKILSSVIRMAGWLGIPTIAEGVETESQRDFLKSIGCDYVQGYYYAKPMPVQEFEELMAKGVSLLERDRHVEHTTGVWSADARINEILTGIQLPVGMIEYSPSRTELIRTNRYFDNAFGKGFLEHFSPYELELLNKAIGLGAATGTAEEEFVYYLPNGKCKYYRMRVKCIERSSVASLLCAVMLDVTAEKLYSSQLGRLEELIPAQKRMKMLIVEDSPLIREMVGSLFSETYDIFEAENGKVGLELLEREKDNISIIILDMLMPVMDGKEFLAKKKAVDKANLIPVIVMSSEGDADLQLDMLAEGVGDYITKPFDSRIFKQKVENQILNAERFVDIRKDYERKAKEEVQVD